jgi:Ca2+-transporting ATPase
VILQFQAEPPTAWHRQSSEQTLAILSSSAAGLSSADAARRLLEHGPNALVEGKRIRSLDILLAQFKNLIIWILIGAALISGALGEWMDCFAILAIVVLNAAIGFYQEFSAEKSIAALKKMTAPRAKVWRDGAVKTAPATEIVPGDILELEAGDLVAADARLLEATSLKCIESALTGESEAVTKRAVTLDRIDLPLGDRENMIFMGTSVAGGSGRAVVVATSMRTELGRIAMLIHEAGADEETPLQQKLDVFGRILVWASLGIVTLLFVLGLARGTHFLDLFLTSVSLAVAAVPEGLPAVVTIALALGVLRMSRRRALVRRLPAVETLGSTNVICTDKTGTLTVGEMTVRALYIAGQMYEVTGEGYGPHGEVRLDGRALDARHATPLLEMANVLIGANNAHLVLEEGTWKVVGDPTEGALLSAGHKAGGSKEQLERELPKHHEIPFDSDRKRHSVVRLLPDGRLRAFVNGAPDLLLARCTHILCETGVRVINDADRNEITAQNAALATRSLRVLGSAYRDLDPASPDELTVEEVERDLVFVGLTGMYDPPRPEVKDAVARCRAAGIRVVMITGDHPQTAMAIARELGIATNDDVALAAAELDRLSDDELRERAPKVAVYARVTAEHKLRIVRAWKANGAVVAMTGDGVNDAPAIKGADIGIAMGRSGTEVTKQASDMIITDDNFASIVAAVEEGRGIYDNIRKTLQYLLAGNTGELLLMTVCVVIGLPTPLLPIHLLWINLVTDGLPALCLATDPIAADVMGRRPRPRNERITDSSFLSTMFFTGVLTAGVSFAVYFYGLKSETPELARTHAFAALVFAELLRSFGARSETLPIWRMNLLSNINLLAVVAISFGVQVWSHHNELLAKFLKTSLLGLNDCVMLLAVSAVPLLALEATKVVRNKSPR